MAKIDYDKKTYRYTNESFSGCDMTATISVKHYDAKLKKERYFHYTLGELTTISYSINMDKTPVRSIGNVNAKDYVIGQRTIAGSLVFSVFNRHFSKNIMKNLNENYDGGTSFLVDEIPPFDVTISAASEYGYRSKLCIFGIRLLNEGQVMSINDVYVENTYQFFATDVDYFDDEMKYSRGKNDLYYLKGNTIEWYEPKNKVVKPNEIKYINDYKRSENIELSVAVKQPAGNRNNGIVDFYITPGIQEGKIHISKSDGTKSSINLKAKTVDPTMPENQWYKNNRVSHASSKLAPGSYSAYVETSNGIKSNKVTFSVIAIKKINKLEKYAPIIKNITSSSFIVMPAVPTHTHVKISKGTSMSKFDTFEIIKGQAKIDGLLSGTKYTVVTFDSNSNMQSMQKVVLTKSELMSDYKRLWLFMSSNSSKLVFTGDIEEYNKLLMEAYTLSETKSLGIKEALIKLKETYESKYSDQSASQADKERYNLAVCMVAEIIWLENKLNNKEKTIVNKDSIKCPIVTINEFGENIVQFSDDTDFAEFYKTTGSMNYFTDHVLKSVFRTIDGNKNCFRFIGDAGTNNFVEAVSSKARSERIYFYIMSMQEREEYIQKELRKSRIEERIVTESQQKAKDEVGIKLSDKETDIVTAIKLKSKDGVIVNPPLVTKTDEGILLSANIDSRKDSDNEFYIAMSTLDEMINDDMIEKVKVNSTDNAFIDYLSTNLYAGEGYVCWIEDSNFNQISNCSSFIFDNIEEAQEIKEYEFKDEADLISSFYEMNIYEDVGINSHNLISKLISKMNSDMATFEKIRNVLKNISFIIGIKAADTYGFNIEHSDRAITINADKDGVMISYSCNGDKKITEISKGTNNILISSDFLIGVCVSDDLTKKSKCFMYNKNSNSVEVFD